MKFVSKQMMVVMGLVFAAGAAGLAVADEIENIAPSMCVASSGTLTYRSDGQVENAGASSVTAVCPAARPNIGGSFTTHFSGNVWVIDRHPSQNVCCRAYSKNPAGAVVTGTQVCSAGESTDYQTLTLPQIDDPYSWSHFYVQCTIPAAYSGARSRILTYRSTQN